MTVLIRAELKDSAWRITRVAGSRRDGHGDAQIQRASELGRAWLTAEYARTSNAADPWRLEYLKSCMGDGETAVGLGELLADACVNRRDVVHEIYAPSREVSLRAVAIALQARGERVESDPVGRSLDLISAAAAAVVALATWAGTLIRTVHEPRTIPPGAEVILAVHGEWSNRTRHVLPLAAGPVKPVPVLLLGRPRRSLAALRRLLADAMQDAPPRMIRPYSLSSALLSAMEASRLVARAVRQLSGARYVPPLRDQAAMLYRLIMGAASARWWHEQEAGRGTVIYGHTGLADTTLLEQAQHATGSNTVHVIHGLSTGPNFAGYSSHALMRCSFDAEYYRELGGYGVCHAPLLDPPPCRRGRVGMLLLTNLAHPMNRGYQHAGVRDEVKLLTEVSGAAAELSAAQPTLAWKPHPVFYSLPTDQRRTLLETARSSGFTVCDQAWPLDRAGEFEFVLCTASTVAIDMLRLGVLPIVFDVQPVASDSAIARLPLRAENRAELVRLIDELAGDRSAYERYFRLAWQAVGPARDYDMHLIRSLAAQGDAVTDTPAPDR